MLIYALYIDIFLLCLSVHVSNIILILKVDILTLLQRIQLIVRRLSKTAALLPRSQLLALLYFLHARSQRFSIFFPWLPALLSACHDSPLFLSLPWFPRPSFVSFRHYHFPSHGSPLFYHLPMMPALLSISHDSLLFSLFSSFHDSLHFYVFIRRRSRFSRSRCCANKPINA